MKVFFMPDQAGWGKKKKKKSPGNKSSNLSALHISLKHATT